MMAKNKIRLLLLFVLFGLCVCIARGQTTPTYTLDYLDHTIGGSTNEANPYPFVDSMQATGDDIGTQLGGPYVVESVLENNDYRANVPYLADGTKVRLKLDKINLPDNADGFLIRRAKEGANSPTPLRNVIMERAEFLNTEPWPQKEYVDIVEPFSVYVYVIIMKYNNGAMEIVYSTPPIQSREDTSAIDLMNHLTGSDCVSAPSVSALDKNQDGNVDIADFLFINSNRAASTKQSRKWRQGR